MKTTIEIGRLMSIVDLKVQFYFLFLNLINYFSTIFINTLIDLSDRFYVDILEDNVIHFMLWLSLVSTAHYVTD